MIMRETAGIMLFLSLQFCSLASIAQHREVDAKSLEEKVSEALKLSNEVIRQYIWNVRTDVTREGKVVDILIEEFGFTADGRLVKKVVNDQEAKLPSSFLIHQVAEEMKTKLVGFMNDLRIFLKQYALEDEAGRKSFFARAVIGSPDVNGEVLVSCKDVLVKGDKLFWWVNLQNYSVTRASVSTVFDGDTVEFTTTNKYFPSGMQTMALAEIMVPAKSIMVQLHFYDFTRHEP
jgi:hypothetical protein